MTGLAEPASGVALVGGGGGRGAPRPVSWRVTVSPGGEATSARAAVAGLRSAEDSGAPGRGRVAGGEQRRAEVRGVGAADRGASSHPRRGGRAGARRVEVDVLKVPHHGSRHQDLTFLLGLRGKGWAGAPTTTTGTHPRSLLAALAGDGCRGAA